LTQEKQRMAMLLCLATF